MVQRNVSDEASTKDRRQDDRREVFAVEDRNTSKDKEKEEEDDTVEVEVEDERVVDAMECRKRSASKTENNDEIHGKNCRSMTTSTLESVWPRSSMTTNEEEPQEHSLVEMNNLFQSNLNSMNHFSPIHWSWPPDPAECHSASSSSGHQRFSTFKSKPEMFDTLERIFYFLFSNLFEAKLRFVHGDRLIFVHKICT